MRWHLIFSIALLWLVMAGGAGCARSPAATTAPEALTDTVDQETASPTPTPAPPTQETIVIPTLLPQGTEAEATPKISPSAGAGAATKVEPPPGAERAVQLASQDLAGRLGLAAEVIQLVSVEAVDWPDTSLGCPQPGMMYAQVITPGFLVLLEAAGERYTYHTDQGRFVVLCEEGGGTSGDAKGEAVSGKPITPDPQSPYYSLLVKAMEELSGRLSADADEIDVLEVEEVIWPDSSLGCPQPGTAYLQVLEDGLLIRLGVRGQVYEYHSGGMRDPFLCEQTIKVQPPAIKLDLTKAIPPPLDTGDK